MSVLRDRRGRLGLTQEQIAKALGVSQQTVARWEGGADIPTKYLRDLAVILWCRMDDLVGPTAAGRGGRNVLDTLSRAGVIDHDEDDEQLLYGTLLLEFAPSAHEAPPASEEAPAPQHMYPVSEAESKGLFRRLQREDDRATWFSFDTLDNWKVFINRSALKRLELLGDDLDAAPPFETPEVYSALSDWRLQRFLEGADVALPELAASYSEKFIEGCRAVVESWGGMEALDERTSGLWIEAIDGRRQHLFSDPAEEAYEALSSFEFEIELGWPPENAPVAEQLLLLSGEGYYRSSFYRLGSLRLIQAPLVAYTRAVAEAEGVEDGALELQR